MNNYFPPPSHLLATRLLHDIRPLRAHRLSVAQICGSCVTNMKVICMSEIELETIVHRVPGSTPPPFGCLRLIGRLWFFSVARVSLIIKFFFYCVYTKHACEASYHEISLALVFPYFAAGHCRLLLLVSTWGKQST